MKCYAVVDTNVLVSALLSKKDNSPTVIVLDYVLDGTVKLVFNDYILTEYDTVLRRKKFGFNVSLVAELMEELRSIGDLIETTDSGVVLPDMKDVPFYEVVLQHDEKSTYLVTGNRKHFPAEPFIVTPAEFLKILSDSEK